MPAPIKKIQAFIDSTVSKVFVTGAINYQIGQVTFPTGNVVTDKNIKLFLQGGFEANQLINKMVSTIGALKTVRLLTANLLILPAL
jgi:hypothetical protein